MKEKNNNKLRASLLTVVPDLLEMSQNQYFDMMTAALALNNKEQLIMMVRRGSMPITSTSRKKDTKEEVKCALYKDFPKKFNDAITNYLKKTFTAGSSDAKKQERVRQNWNDENKRQLIKSLLESAFEKDAEDLILPKEEEINKLYDCLQICFDELSSTVAYTLDKYFAAFCRISSDDRCFLSILLNKSTEDKIVLTDRLLSMETMPMDKILDKIMSDEWKQWVKIRNIYCFHENTHYPSQPNWDKFKKKAGKLRYIELLNLIALLIVIVPDETGKLNMGESEIDTLLLFKYFLTADAQQALLASIG